MARYVSDSDERVLLIKSTWLYKLVGLKGMGLSLGYTVWFLAINEPTPARYEQVDSDSQPSKHCFNHVKCNEQTQTQSSRHSVDESNYPPTMKTSYSL